MFQQLVEKLGKDEATKIFLQNKIQSDQSSNHLYRKNFEQTNDQSITKAENDIYANPFPSFEMPFDSHSLTASNKTLKNK
jgi:hypothetical protein